MLTWFTVTLIVLVNARLPESLVVTVTMYDVTVLKSKACVVTRLAPLMANGAPPLTVKVCVSLASGSTAVRAPTIAPADSPSFTAALDRVMSVGALLTWPTLITTVAVPN